MVGGRQQRKREIGRKEGTERESRKVCVCVWGGNMTNDSRKTIIKAVNSTDCKTLIIKLIIRRIIMCLIIMTAAAGDL